MASLRSDVSSTLEGYLLASILEFQIVQDMAIVLSDFHYYGERFSRETPPESGRLKPSPIFDRRKCAR